MSPDDVTVVGRQLGREPRGRWRVVATCRFDRPTVIAVAPVLADGSRFPTTFWLTCPHLVEAVHGLESRGVHVSLGRTIGEDEAAAGRARRADALYREARRMEAGGDDPCREVGVAGQADPGAVKCLHARLAAVLAGIPDPVGEAVLEIVRSSVDGTPWCVDDRCGGLVTGGC